MSMKKIIEVLGAFADDEKGATAVEYAIISSLIAAVIVAIVMQVGIKTRNLFVINGW